MAFTVNKTLVCFDDNFIMLDVHAVTVHLACFKLSSHVTREICLAAYGGNVLQWFVFIKVRMGKKGFRVIAGYNCITARKST